MNKIDFFGGLHGNYLELVVNLFVFKQQYDLSQPIFTTTGACHHKNDNLLYKNERSIFCNHWSHFQIDFNTDDMVIRIVATEDDLLIALTNSFLRAGDQLFDLNNFEIDTISKLEKLPKASSFLKTLIRDYGVRNCYSRSVLRNYFYSMFEDSELGLDMLNNFTPVQEFYNFPFSAFFNTRQFYTELNLISKFFQENFYPTTNLSCLHQEFLKTNQGYHSQLKCDKTMANILSGNQENINLNIIEEAWVNWQIAKIFRCYDLPILQQDIYPKNTLDITQAVYKWKSLDYSTN